MEDKGQILLYQTPDGESRIEVRLEGETVWLNQEQMAELFQRGLSRSFISWRDSQHRRQR